MDTAKSIYISDLKPGQNFTHTLNGPSLYCVGIALTLRTVKVKYRYAKKTFSKSLKDPKTKIFLL